MIFTLVRPLRRDIFNLGQYTIVSFVYFRYILYIFQIWWAPADYGELTCMGIGANTKQRNILNE